MKAPITLTILILATGLFCGVHKSRKVSALRLKHSNVFLQAAVLGLSTDISESATVRKVSNRQPKDSERNIKEFTNKLLASAKEYKALEKSGTKPDDEMMKRSREINSFMNSLNGDELKILIAELSNRTDISDELRKGKISTALLLLAKIHPESALTIFTQSSDLMKNNPLSDHFLMEALEHWATDQPSAALEWIKKTEDKHPELINIYARAAVVQGVAKDDIGLAFQLMNEMEVKDKDDYEPLVRFINAEAKTPEQKAELLALLRNNVGTSNNKEGAAKMLDLGLERMFSNASADGFDQTMKWIESASLSPAEINKYTSDLNFHYPAVKADSRKWLDWLSSDQTSSKISNQTVNHLVRNCTQTDYVAAGEWLTSIPEGPLKETATMSYLQTVAPYDSEVAAQWADTLPATQRVEALKSIHRQIMQKDKAAADAFLKTHGIEPE
jgi:hypothetical protein